MQEILGGRKQRKVNIQIAMESDTYREREKKELGKKSSRLQHSSKKGSPKLMESPWAKTACWKSLVSVEQTYLSTLVSITGWEQATGSVASAAGDLSQLCSPGQEK